MSYSPRMRDLRSKFDSDFERDERRMKWFGRFIFAAVGLVFLVVIGLFCVQGYVAYQVATHPEQAGQFVGKLFKGMKDEAFK